MQTEPWPELRVADWTETRDALHLWTQIVGKVRMAKAPMVNHWWHVTFAVTPRGLTTGAIPDGNRYFEMTFDFVDQVLRIEVQGGERREIPLAPGSVAAFYAATMAALSELAIDVEIWPVPVEIEHVTPFADDVEPRDYDPAQARLFWLQLVQASRVLSIFRGRFAGKVEPGPLLLGRDRPRRHPLLGPLRAEASRRRAQLRRLGDGRGLLARARELRLLAGRRRGGRVLRLRLSGARRLPERPVRPAEAYYYADGGQFLLPYEAVRRAEDPDATLLAFLEDTYAAAADLGGWDRKALDYVPVEPS